MVGKRYIIKGHAIERFSERVYGIKKPIDLMTPDETDEIKRAIRQDLARARELVGAERMVLVSRVRFPSGRSAPKYAGKFISRADTNMLRFEDRVYFVRSGSPIVVSMMILNAALVNTMDELSAHDTAPVVSDDVPTSPARSVPSDARAINCSAHVVLARDAFTLMQTMLGWSHKRAIAEFRKVLSDQRSYCTFPIGARLCTYIGRQPHPRARYVLHAQAHLIVGVVRRSVEPDEYLHYLSVVDEIVDAILLTPEQCAWLLAHMPSAVYASFDSVLECSSHVFLRMLTIHGWDMPSTMHFIIRQFRDPETRRIDLHDEPSVHTDLPATDNIVCYRTPECFLWLDGIHVVECVLTHEASYDEEDISQCGT